MQACVVSSLVIPIFPLPVVAAYAVVRSDAEQRVRRLRMIVVEKALTASNGGAPAVREILRAELVR